jgi:hypothetical protein
LVEGSLILGAVLLVFLVGALLIIGGLALMVWGLQRFATGLVEYME